MQIINPFIDSFAVTETVKIISLRARSDTMEKLYTHSRYKEDFNEKVAENALKQALDIRKFEIELYWKRTAYFWSLIAAAFAGYFALANQPQKELSLTVACIGLILSFSWYLVNRGSKYWQTNWERHVDCLEDEGNGPLYKTTLSKDEFSVFRFWSGYPFSVSRVNQLVSLFTVIIWLALLAKSFPERLLPETLYVHGHWWLVGFTFAYMVILVVLCIGHSEKRPRKVSFSQRILQDAVKFSNTNKMSNKSP